MKGKEFPRLRKWELNTEKQRESSDGNSMRDSPIHNETEEWEDCEKQITTDIAWFVWTLGKAVIWSEYGLVEVEAFFSPSFFF